MGCLSDASRACSALILLAINCVLLAGGALVLYGSLHAQHSGWVDVVASYWSGAHAILTALTVVGGVIIALAVLGSIAACCRWRVGLLVYAWLVALVLLAFVVVAVFAFMVRGKAVDWKAMAYPATTDETSLKTEFDRAYCLAQGAYICNEMGMQEAAQIFYPTYANSSLTGLFTNLKGVNAICDVLLPSVPALQSVCKGCVAAKQLANFTSVLNWANDKCPRTDKTLLWCGTFLGQSNSGADIAVGMAPYSQCRPAFLDLIKGWATTLGVGSLVVCGGAFLVVVFACVLRRRERREQQYEQTPYDTPQTNAPYYSDPQHAGQGYGQGYDQRYGKV